MSQETLARPYAKAAFLMAQQHDAFSKWWNFLSAAKQYTMVPEVATLFKNPLIPAKVKIEAFSSIVKDSIFDEAIRFLEVLAEKKRLMCLHSIAELFEQMMNAVLKKMNFKVSVAFPLKDEEIQKIKVALREKYHADINLECEINPQLLGGMIIRSGDEVMDGSVKGRLKNLCEAVLNESKR